MDREYNIAVVLSAGIGKRMNSSVPKQYIQIDGKPLIYYTLRAFEISNDVQEIILVTGQEDIDWCQTEIVNKYGLKKVKRIVAGGKERYHSVFNALCAIHDPEKCSYVLIHDGARPMVSEAVIERNLESARVYGNGCTGVPVKDTIKLCNTEGIVEQTLPRNMLYQVQTPQTFSFSLIKKAYDIVFEKEMFDGITDDAMIMELTGTGKVRMVMGEYSNIKVTTPEDLILAAHYLI